MEKYETVFTALESIVVDIQTDLIESEDDAYKALVRLERSYIEQVMDLLWKAHECRQIVLDKPY